jgi:hypothetical protein
MVTCLVPSSWAFFPSRWDLLQGPRWSTGDVKTADQVFNLRATGQHRLIRIPEGGFELTVFVRDRIPALPSSSS